MASMMMILCSFMHEHRTMVHAHQFSCEEKGGTMKLGKCYYLGSKDEMRDPVAGQEFCQAKGYQGLLQVENDVEAQNMFEGFSVWTGIQKRRDNIWVQRNDLKVGKYIS